MDPALNGSFIFGTACHVVHIPNPIAQQKDGYFGISGLSSLYGGSRGRSFQITGVFVGFDIGTLLLLEGNLLSFADGITRTFTDTMGRNWPNVIFEGEYSPYSEGPKPFGSGWVLPYQCVLVGLS